MAALSLLVVILGASAISAGFPSATPSFLFMLGDDIGWADFRYNNGTAAAPRISEWVARAGTVLLQDFHSGGTVCSPTRATILTGRNHFRDCVQYVYGCSDMTECVPDFEFAPRRTFTVADAVRASDRNYTSWFGGKWHLGAFYNDSEWFGGRTSSPITHGFDHMNATVEVAPTATANCECDAAWQPHCLYGHYGQMVHCYVHRTLRPDPSAKKGCCFNYWWNDARAPHGVANLTRPSPPDDAAYLADAFVRFLERQRGAPFLAQISFHNCHVPFVGTAARRAACAGGAACAPPLPGAAAYSDDELDFYACLTELDHAVGAVLDALQRLGYYDNTMVWFATDNGPETNCPPEGRCGSGPSGAIPPGTLHRPQCQGPGSAGPLRGRKRDVWEGGHRVPGAVSWPAVVGDRLRVSWAPVVTMDFLATVLEVLGVERPPAQRNWHFDGVSIMPILRGQTPVPRGIGWMYNSPHRSARNGYAFRYGKWKYVVGGISCDPKKATFDCHRPQLYDMDHDYAEAHDLAEREPEVLAAIARNFSKWYDSIHDSIANESRCGHRPSPVEAFPPGPITASTACTFHEGVALGGGHMAEGSVASREECCGACVAVPGCGACEFVEASRMRPTFEGVATGGTCRLKRAFEPRPGGTGEGRTAAVTPTA